MQWFPAALERSHDGRVLPVPLLDLLERIDLIVAGRNALNLKSARRVRKRDLMIDAEFQTAFGNHHDRGRCNRLSARIEHTAGNGSRIRSHNNDEFRLRRSCYA